MRGHRRVSRTAGILILTLIPLLLGAGPAASAEGVVLAQDPNTEEDVVGNEEEAEGQESSDDENVAEESGAGQGETEAAAEETGPPWTYQMARLGILLVVVMVLGVGFAYYRFVLRRQRGAV